MVRTSARVATLRELLGQAGLDSISAKPARPSGVPHTAELDALYRELGGLLPTPVWRPGAWDIVFVGPLVVELDEELHFNRYRALTLTASWAKDLPWTYAYRSYCIEYEDRCLATGDWGKRWTNDSCGRMFSGGPAGQLDGDGAPRWKQRAFYDAVKDTGVGNEIGVAMARIAIYDAVDGVLLEDVLERRAAAEPSAVLALVERRTVAAGTS